MGFAKFAHGVCKVRTWGLQSLRMGCVNGTVALFLENALNSFARNN